MKWLVDTRCWLWITSQPERFSPKTRDELARSDTDLLFSAASAWEIAIKYRLGKLRLPAPPGDYVASRLKETRTVPLPISCEHASQVSDLPLHHRDPFDRLLIVQARSEASRFSQPTRCSRGTTSTSSPRNALLHAGDRRTPSGGRG